MSFMTFYTGVIHTIALVIKIIFRIGTVRYAEGLRRMRRHGPVIAHCTDSEDFPTRILTFANGAFIITVTKMSDCFISKIGVIISIYFLYYFSK